MKRAPMPLRVTLHRQGMGTHGAVGYSPKASLICCT